MDNQLKAKAESAISDVKDAFYEHTHKPVNTSESERWLSVAGGVGLMVYGLKNRGLTGLILGGLGAGLLYRGSTGHCALYNQIGLDRSVEDNRDSFDGHSGVKVEESIFVAAPIDALYRYWRKLENLPNVMSHLESVTELSRGESEWKATGPLGSTVSWKAEIITDRENELISWRSLPGSLIQNAGSVWFSRDEAGAGTQIKVSLIYSPPAGRIGASVAKMLGDDPARQIAEDLRKFKEAAESNKLSLTSFE